MIVINETTPNAYETMVEQLSKEDPTSSRSGTMKEILNVAVVSDNPRERYLYRDDKWNLAFQLQEHFAYWKGLNPGHVERYVDMSQWLDDDGKLPGSAYGDRLRNTAGHDQIQRVINQLDENPESRRAVMQVHQASIEDYNGPDVSCTESLQLFIRDGKLHMTAIIRSQDVYWGYAYDAANNQYLQEVIAGHLNVDLGTYTHVMNSCHYYTEFETDAKWSLDEYQALETSDCKLSPFLHNIVMDKLTTGLSQVRDGKIPSAKIEELENLSGHYADWLMVMAAYEQKRYHDNVDGAITLTEGIGEEAWHNWMVDYVR